MPDYQGLGADTSELHPYLVADHAGKGAADMARGAIGALESGQYPGLVWNGQVFVIGYSQGGASTLSAVLELGRNGVTVTGAVPMDGPYDLVSLVSHFLDPAIPSNRIIQGAGAALIMGFYQAYPKALIFKPSVAFQPAYAQAIPPLYDGIHELFDLAAQMPVPLSNAFSLNFLTQVNTPESQVRLALEYNSSGFKLMEKLPIFMHFIHFYNDDVIPKSQTEKIISRFPGATYDYLTDNPDISPPAPQTKHEAIALEVMTRGMAWIKDHDHSLPILTKDTPVHSSWYGVSDYRLKPFMKVSRNAVYFIIKNQHNIQNNPEQADWSGRMSGNPHDVETTFIVTATSSSNVSRQFRIKGYNFDTYAYRSMNNIRACYDFPKQLILCYDENNDPPTETYRGAFEVTGKIFGTNYEAPIRVNFSFGP